MPVLQVLGGLALVFTTAWVTCACCDHLYRFLTSHHHART